MLCEQGIIPSCGVFKENPNMATGTTFREAREIEGFIILEAPEGGPGPQGKASAEWAPPGRRGSGGGSPGPSQGWGAELSKTVGVFMGAAECQ